jgi:hypothetical protein
MVDEGFRRLTERGNVVVRRWPECGAFGADEAEDAEAASAAKSRSVGLRVRFRAPGPAACR